VDANFLKALEFTLKWEGGYVNDPKDPGGETKFGISKQKYPDEDITHLTLARACELYERDYWLQWKCNERPMPLGAVAFDLYVNHKPSTATDLLRDTNEWRTVIRRRKDFYGRRVAARPDQQKFLKGWLARANDLDKFCVIWENDHGDV